MTSRAPASSLSQERMRNLAKACQTSADKLKSVTSSTCPVPFKDVLTTVVDILSFFAGTYCDLVANREDAEKLARACESVGTSICHLVVHLPDFALDPSVSRLHKLLYETDQYVRGALTPPPRRKKQWIITRKFAANVKVVHERLENYEEGIREQLRIILHATSVSLRVPVADPCADTRDGELARAESNRGIVQEELGRIQEMLEVKFGRIQEALRQVRSEQSLENLPSAIVDREADELSDIVLAAQHCKKLLQEDIVLRNITLELTAAEKIYKDVDQLRKKADSVAGQLNRPLKIENWMVDANSVAYDTEGSHICKGASGTVYHGRMDNLNVAVKVFNVTGKSSREIETAIRKEVKAWHEISDHKNIVSLFGVSTKVKHFIVSEFCLHGTSRQYLGRLREERATWRMALMDVLCDAAEGLKFLHSKGLIHWDINGANILVREDGSAALSDFGLSRVVGSLSTASVGTWTMASAMKWAGASITMSANKSINWCSPEQMQFWAPTVTTKTDTWSFGMTVFELLEDKEPFSDSLNVWLAINAFKPVIPVGVEAELAFLVTLISDCCKKLPTDRLTDDGILDRLNSGMPLRKLFNDSPRLVKLMTNESDALLLRSVLELIVLPQERFTLAGIAALLDSKPDKIDGILGALEPALTADGRGRLQLKDPRFADYLADPRRCTDPRFAVDKTAANLRIAAHCLNLLSRELRPNMCGFRNDFEASRRIADMSSYEREELRGRIPAHVVYAARFWAAHVCGSPGQATDPKFAAAVTRDAAWPKVQQCIKSFATTAMVFWIEVLAAVGALDTLRTAAVSLAPLISNSNEAHSLFTEAATLLDRFSELRSGSPACVYVSVISLLPQGSEIRRLLGGSAVLPFPIAVAQRPAFESVTLLRTLKGHTDEVFSVAISNDGRTVLSGSLDHTIKLWEAATGRLLRTGPVVRWSFLAEQVTSVAFNNNGRTFASGSSFRTIKLWKPETGQLLETLEGHSGIVYSVTFSRDGGTLVSGSDDKTIKLWKVETGKLLRTLQGHSDCVRSVAFSSDDKTVASGSLDKTIRLWEPSTGRLLHTLEGHSRRVNSVAFSSNSCTVASGSIDKTIKLWEAATGRLLRTLKGHSGSVFSVAFSSDGQTFASGSEDKTIKLWNTATWQLLRTMEGHTSSVFSVVFSSDSRTVVSGSRDKTIKLWRASAS